MKRSAPLWLVIVVVTLGCSSEGTLLTPIDQAQAPGASDGGGLVECTIAVVGNGQDCIANAELKTQATAACAAQGLVLDQGGASDLCDAQSARLAKFVCCPEALRGACTHETQGGPASCASAADWTAQAARSCALSGLSSQALLLSEPCAGGYHVVRYLCCPRI